MTYSKAVQRVLWRKKALALAQPYSVVVLAHGGGALKYNEGFLSYIDGPTIRILDVYSASATETVINLKGLLDQEQGRWPIDDLRTLREDLDGDFDEPSCYGPQINHQDDGKVSVLFVKRGFARCAIIDVRKDVHSSYRRVRRIWDFQGINSHTLFAQQQAFLATNLNSFEDGLDRWVVWCFDLQDPDSLPCRIHLNWFDGSKINEDYVFDIHDGWLYALCLTLTSESELQGFREPSTFAIASQWDVPILSFRRAMMTVQLTVPYLVEQKL